MNKLLLVGFLSLLLSGCGEPKKINMAEYGFKEEGTLYVKKVDSISAIYNDRNRNNVEFNCIDIAYDGQTRTFCNERYTNELTDRANAALKAPGFDQFWAVSYEDESIYKPNEINLNNLKRFEKSLHQVANDHSVFDSISELIAKFK